MNGNRDAEDNKPAFNCFFQKLLTRVLIVDSVHLVSDSTLTGLTYSFKMLQIL